MEDRDEGLPDSRLTVNLYEYTEAVWWYGPRGPAEVRTWRWPKKEASNETGL